MKEVKVRIYDDRVAAWLTRRAAVDNLSESVLIRLLLSEAHRRDLEHAARVRAGEKKPAPPTEVYAGPKSVG